MGTIDERIVKLSFDNKGFESGIQKTLQSLDALNKALEKSENSQAAKNLSKAFSDVKLDGIEQIANKKGIFSKLGESISNIGTSFMNVLKKLDFTGIFSKITSGFSGATQGTSALASGVEAVSSKFSHLQVVAATALANITNRMVNAGIAMVKSLTIDPIKSGLDEYELKMNSIQTILTNTSHNGTTLDQVNAALSELNTYADKTIYNFGQMTDNIGKFTAAGVDLDTSVAAIKGIANLAAASGSSSSQASTAMYQLSQALAAGKVSLMDWNSVVNAGMGGKLFQDALIRTSEHLGTGAEAMIEKYGSFRESLTKGEWLTTDVLTETLKQISGAYTEADLIAQGYTKSQAKAITELAKNATAAATEVKTVSQLFDTMKESVQSGWAQTWEYIIGDKDQATKMLTTVKDAFDKMIGESTEARNKMFKEWNEGGGRDAILGGLGNIFGSIGKVAGSIKDAFRDIFPAMTGAKLIELSNGFKKFTENLKVSDKTAGMIKDTFKGVFSVFDLVKTGVVSLFKAFSTGVGIFGGLTNGVLTVTSTIGKFFTAINNGVKTSGIFDKIASSISKGISNIGEGFSKIGSFISGLLSSISLSNFKPIFDFVGQIGSGLGEGIVSVFSGIGKAISNINLNTVFGALTMLFSKGIFDKIKDVFGGVGDIFDNISEIGSSVSDILSSVTSHLKAMTLDVNANALIKIAGAVGILAVSLQLLSSIDSNSMNTAITGLVSAIILLVGAFAALTKLQGMGSKGGLLSGLFGGGIKLTSTAAGLLVFSSAVLVLAGAIKTLSSLNPQELITGLAGVAGSMLVLVGAAKLLDGVKVPLIKAGASLILVAAALNVMASAVKSFAEINPNNMLVGLMGIAATLVELAAFMKLADFGGLNVSSAVGLLGVAAALLVLQNAVSKFGSMDLSSMIQGLLGVAGALGTIAAFSHLAGSAASMLVMAAALVVMGGALHVLSSAVRSMAGMDWDDMARGLTVMAGSLAILAAAVHLMSGVGLLAVGAGLIVASAGLLVMSAAIKSLAELSWEEMARGLVALAGGLLVLGVATAAMSGMVVGAAALLIVAAAMAVLTPQLVAMSNLSWSQVAIGLTMLAGAMVVLGVAGVAAAAIAPGLAILAAAVLLLGVGCLAAGAGVSLFATGLAALAAVGAGGMFAITEALRNLINLLPQVGTKMGEFITNMATAFAQGLPQIAAAIGQAMVGILEAIRTYGPQIVAVGTELIVLLANALLQAGPQLANVAVQLITMLLQGLAGAAGMLAQAGADLVVNLINGLAANIGPIIQAGIDLAIKFIDGIAEGISGNAGRLGESIGNAISAALSGIGAMLGGVLKGIGSDWIGDLAEGLLSGVSEVVGAVKEVVSEAKSAAENSKSQFNSGGKAMVDGLAQGIKNGASTVQTAIKNIADKALNTVKQQSSKFQSAGKDWSSKLASGIKSGSGQVSSAVTSVVNSAVSKAKSGNSQMRSAGASMMDGFAAGIRSRAASAAAAAASAVASAIAAAKAKLQINSPSKVFMQIGKWTVMGMEKGLDNNAYRVANSASGMADSAINAMQSSIARIASAVNDNIDANPTIRPVLDLSNVEEGARALNGMLGDSQLNADLSGNMSRSVGTIQNGNGNRELLSAIKDLQGNMGNTGDTYQINGITYDDGSAISSAVQTLIRAAKIERRM